MKTNKLWLVALIGLISVSAAAQTMTSSGTTGTVGNIPYISAASSTSTTLGTSPVTVSGSNVGIGTTNPNGKLEVRADGSTGSVVMRLSTPDQTFDNPLDIVWLGLQGIQGAENVAFRIGYPYASGVSSGNPLDLIKVNNGNTILATDSSNMSLGGVGIGTANPSGKLEVQTGGSNGSVVMRLSTPDQTFNNPLDIVWLGFQGITGAENVAFRIGYPYASGVSSGNPLDLIKVNGGNTILATDSLNASLGNVGIGTTSPAAKLDVSGNIKLSVPGTGIVFPDGSVQTLPWTGSLCGGDYAESVDVSGGRANYEPGDVLVIDLQHPGKFLKSSEPYSTALAGIYSTKPGVVGRRQTTPQTESTEEVPMAMIGIVPTKVSDENGPIKPGDFTTINMMRQRLVDSGGSQ